MKKTNLLFFCLILCLWMACSPAAYAANKITKLSASKSLKASSSKTKIKMRAGATGTATIKIYKSKGKKAILQKTILKKKVRRDKTYVAYWDGRKTNGDYATPGKYKIIAKLKNSTKSKYVTLKHDKSECIFTSKSTSPATSYLNIEFSMSKKTDAFVSIENPKNHVVAKWAIRDLTAKKSKKITWNLISQKNSDNCISGKRVPNGAYRVIIQSDYPKDRVSWFVNVATPQSGSGSNSGSDTSGTATKPNYSISLPNTLVIAGKKTIPFQTSGSLAGVKPTWQSSNTAIATVNADGVVQSVSAGTCVVTATFPNGAQAKTTIRSNVFVSPSNGTYIIQLPTPDGSQKCMTKAGTNVGLRYIEKSNAQNQVWELTDYGNGVYRIKLAADTSYYLKALSTSSSYNLGTNVGVGPYNYWQNTDVRFVKTWDGRFEIVPVFNFEGCFAAEGYGSGSNISYQKRDTTWSNNLLKWKLVSTPRPPSIAVVRKWPTPGYTHITSYFGPRIPPTAGASSYHKGIDIGAPSGASIVAMQGGTVTFAGWANDSGYKVAINHGNGLVTEYLHQLAGGIKVIKGQSVVAGQRIGTVGSTGVTTGAHLHFSVVLNGVYKDPLLYVKP